MHGAEQVRDRGRGQYGAGGDPVPAAVERPELPGQHVDGSDEQHGNTVNYSGPVREPVRVTRPGTPMTGPYSVNQMDDFYAALAAGQVKPTGIMNYIQRLFIAERCGPGARVIDVCCGRGLQLPVLYRYAPHIACYLGLDITQAHLDEARARATELDDAHGARPFEIGLAQCDVAGAWPPCPPAEVIIYTSALEHLPRDAGAASLRHAAGSTRRRRDAVPVHAEHPR